MGFPGIVTVGVLSVAFLAELMTQRFGRGFYEGGTFDCVLCCAGPNDGVRDGVRQAR